jgi:hypothetical protein
VPPVREHRRGLPFARGPGYVQEIGKDGSVICPLPSDLCSWRARGWARAQHEKGIWWMPWYREAMKDVARCEKPRGGASAR